MTTDAFVRFSPWRRFEHVAVMTLFIVLSLTGLPQKFFTSDVSRSIILALGGIDRVRWLHRASGIAFALLVIQHVAVAAGLVISRRTQLTLVPARQDFIDAITTLKYYLGVVARPPRFDRFDYRQKFEYWGLVMGAFIVIGTGVVLMWPTLLARMLPGELIPAAKVAHSNEGLLAFLVVIVWHIYNAHLNPDVFPFDTSIFTGRISRERMMHEHPLEYERLAQTGDRPDDRRVA
jgi:cytochrome b subunit of formate dehydrogenase